MYTYVFTYELLLLSRRRSLYFQLLWPCRARASTFSLGDRIVIGRRFRAFLCGSIFRTFSFHSLCALFNLIFLSFAPRTEALLPVFVFCFSFAVIFNIHSESIDLSLWSRSVVRFEGALFFRSAICSSNSPEKKREKVESIFCGAFVCDGALRLSK